MTPSREDYILNIFRQMEERGYAANKDISESLHISKPSVTEMMRKLEQEGLVQAQGRKIYLTAAGEEQARHTLSKHRLWESFLQEQLQLPKDIVHQQADLLEHVTGEELFHALNRYLGYPPVSPHGSPIYENQKKSE